MHNITWHYPKRNEFVLTVRWVIAFACPKRLYWKEKRNAHTKRMSKMCVCVSLSLFLNDRSIELHTKCFFFGVDILNIERISSPIIAIELQVSVFLLCCCCCLKKIYFTLSSFNSFSLFLSITISYSACWFSIPGKDYWLVILYDTYRRLYVWSSHTE